MCVALTAWCLFMGISSCLVSVHRELIRGPRGLCCSHPASVRRADTFVRSFRQPGVRAGLQGGPEDVERPGCWGGHTLEKSPGRLPFRISACSQSGSDWGEGSVWPAVYTCLPSSQCVCTYGISPDHGKRAAPGLPLFYESQYLTPRRLV